MTSTNVSRGDTFVQVRRPMPRARAIPCTHLRSHAASSVILTSTNVSRGDTFVQFSRANSSAPPASHNNFVWSHPPVPCVLGGLLAITLVSWCIGALLSFARPSHPGVDPVCVAVAWGSGRGLAPSPGLSALVVLRSRVRVRSPVRVVPPPAPLYLPGSSRPSSLRRWASGFEMVLLSLHQGGPPSSNLGRLLIEPLLISRSSDKLSQGGDASRLC